MARVLHILGKTLQQLQLHLEECERANMNLLKLFGSFGGWVEESDVCVAPPTLP